MNTSGSLPATGGSIRRHRTAEGMYAPGDVGGNGLKRKLEGWVFLIGGSAVAFASGLLLPMMTLL